MRRVLIGIAALFSSPAHAQLYNPPSGVGLAVDQTARDAAANAQATANAAATPASVSSAISVATAGVVKSVNTASPDGNGNVALNIPSTSSIASQITTATSGLATSGALSAVSVTIPVPCVSAPSGDTLNGSLGSGTNCVAKQDSTRPTSVQSGNTTLAADCSFSITFARTFTSASPFVYAAVIDNTNTQMPCKIKTRSTTGATGICSGAQQTVLSLSVVTSGITILPFGTTCTAGTPVMFVGREPTQ